MRFYGESKELRVISELAKSEKSKKKPNPPFRESKLTYILKDFLRNRSEIA